MDFQTYLSTGDHGLLLYAAEAVFRGERPYHDFHFFYGPLMPYYYGFFLKALGVNILSVVFAQTLLNFLAGITIYLIISTSFSPLLAFVSAI